MTLRFDPHFYCILALTTGRQTKKIITIDDKHNYLYFVNVQIVQRLNYITVKHR